MAKRPTPGKALGGGNSCFQADGTYTKNACDALRLAAKKLAAAVSKIQSITEDRNAWRKEFPTLKGEKRKERAVQIVEALDSLKLYRDEKLKYGGTLGRIIAGLDEGKFNVDMKPGEIVDEARAGGKPGEDDDEQDDEEEGGADQPGLTFTGHGSALPCHAWQDQWKAYPAVFGEREWPVVHNHVARLHELKLGAMVVGTPHALARYIAGSFAKLKTTKDWMEILPHAPEWFRDSVRELLARHAVCELAGKSEAGAEKDAAEMLKDLRDAFDRDPDAFLHLAGGKGSLLELTVNQTAKAAV